MRGGRRQAIVSQMVAAQEELDWECLNLYGLTEESLTVRRVRGAAVAAGGAGVRDHPGAEGGGG